MAVNVKVFRALVFFDPVIPVLGMWPRQIALKLENDFCPALFMIVKYWGKRGGGVGGVERGKTVIDIYCMKEGEKNPK